MGARIGSLCSPRAADVALPRPAPRPPSGPAAAPRAEEKCRGAPVRTLAGALLCLALVAATADLLTLVLAGIAGLGCCLRSAWQARRCRERPEPLATLPAEVRNAPASRRLAAEFLDLLLFRLNNFKLPLADACAARAEPPPGDRDVDDDVPADPDWRDVSRPGFRAFMRWPKFPARLFLCMEIRVEDQTPNLPLVEVDGGRVLGGLIPVFFSVAHWPQWCPFCESCQLLGRISPNQELWLVRFKCSFITADAVIMISLVDNLDASGSLDLIIGSPDEGNEGNEWLGVTVPAKTALIRVPISAFRISVKPSRDAGNVVRMQAEFVDHLQVEWIHILFWTTLFGKVLPILAGVHEKFAGSEIEAYYESPARPAREASAHMARLSAHLSAFLARGG